MKCFFTALFHINKTVKNKKPLWVLSKAAFLLKVRWKL